MSAKTAEAGKFKKRYKIKASISDRTFDICNTIFLVCVMIISLYPFANVLAVS